MCTTLLGSTKSSWERDRPAPEKLHIHIHTCSTYLIVMLWSLPRGVYSKNVEVLQSPPVSLINAMINEGRCFPQSLYASSLLTPVPPPPQVTWIYEPKEGERINIAVFHPNFDPNYPDSPVKGRVSFTPSPPSLASPSIQISEVRMTDEGRYICEYATYPSGNEQGITHLVMLGKSQIIYIPLVYKPLTIQSLKTNPNVEVL